MMMGAGVGVVDGVVLSFFLLMILAQVLESIEWNPYRYRQALLFAWGGGASVVSFVGRKMMLMLPSQPFCCWSWKCFFFVGCVHLLALRGVATTSPRMVVVVWMSSDSSLSDAPKPKSKRWFASSTA